MKIQTEQYTYCLVDRLGKTSESVIAETLNEALEKLHCGPNQYRVVYEFYKMAVIENKHNNRAFGVTWL